jgi:enamine deaminase RidA (YjgF/YER057c/UK114 family)
MSVEKINPPGLAAPAGYAHVAVAEGTKRVYIAGQVGTGPDGEVVGPDLTSQTAQAFRNVGTALEAAGATWDDVVKLSYLIVDYDAAKGGEFFAGIGEAFGDAMPITAATLIGVQALYQPELLIEIEAIAEI